MPHQLQEWCPGNQLQLNELPLSTTSKRLAFKYRSGDGSTFARDLGALEHSQIFAAPRGVLNDPFEGRFDRKTLDGQLNVLHAVARRLVGAGASAMVNVEQALNEVLAFVDKSGVFSLSYTPLNELLWAHYGGSHQGFCVGYDLDKLIEFDPQNLHRLDVEYLDSSPSLHGNDFFLAGSQMDVLRKILGTKSTPWLYEQEVRLIATPPGLHKHDFRAVQEVYFGLRCPEATRMAVMRCLSGRGVTYKQVTSAGTSYRLEATVIPDAFDGAPAFGANLAPVAECAISMSHLKPEQQPFAEYLTKAAEIVRRDPYCKEVEMVEFSGSRSKPGAPVIFVNYVHPHRPSNWGQRHFTIAEIDREYGRWPT